MPIRYEVSADGTVVRATATGEITPEEIYAFIEAITQDDRIKPGFRELLDASQITSSKVEMESFPKIKQLVFKQQWFSA